MVYLVNQDFELTPRQSSVSFKLKNTKISNKLLEPLQNAGNITFEENFNKSLLNIYME